MASTRPKMSEESKEEFTDEAWKGLVEGKDQIPVGFVGKAFDAFENKRQEMYKQIFLSQS